MGLLRVLLLLTVACHLVAAFVAQPPLVRRAVVHNREAAPIVCAEPTPEEVTKKWGFEAGMFSALKGAGKGEGEGGGMVKAGDLLKRYGGAYLLTSTSLALVSFTLCYILVDNGVDVTGACFAQTADARAIFVPSRLSRLKCHRAHSPAAHHSVRLAAHHSAVACCAVAALLGKVGIQASSTSETAGTVGLAYVAHKAASPIRFPPTVALTPIVAKKVFGKSEEELEQAAAAAEGAPTETSNAE